MMIECIMSEKSELIDISKDFLKAVAKEAEKEFGDNLQKEQIAGWLIRKGSGSESRHFKRITFDRGKVSTLFQLKLKRSGFPEQERLQGALISAGVPKEEIPFGFIQPLINRWRSVPNPFSFGDPAFLSLLKEFAEAVLDGKIYRDSRIIIDGLEAEYLPIVFNDSIVIRPINEEELWTLGDDENLQFSDMHFPGYYPDSDWKILDIKQRFNRKIEDINSDDEYVIFDAILASLRLESSGSLRFFNLGSRNNFGIGSIGHSVKLDRVPQEVGRHEGHFYLDKEKIVNLQSHWSKIFSIIGSDSHYLRLSAMRLIDGGSRNQPKDAIIDYSVGLESLLNEGENEIAYKFALRGATILSWEGGIRKDYYKNLHEIYRIRSSLVHGDKRIKQKRLNIEEASHIAEEYLRRIWWWYLIKNIPSINKGIDIINDKILDP